MMILEEIKSIKCGNKELRSFGFVVGGILLLLGFYMLWRGKPHYPFFLTLGTPLVLFGALYPPILKWPNILWMSLGIVMGAVVAPLIVAMLFFLGITPVALIARLFRHSFLDRKARSNANSYWIPKDNSKRDTKSYETQF